MEHGPCCKGENIGKEAVALSPAAADRDRPVIEWGYRTSFRSRRNDLTPLSFMPTDGPSCRILFRSAAAMFQADKSRAHDEVKMLNALAENADWILLQDVHGAAAVLRVRLTLHRC